MAKRSPRTAGGAARRLPVSTKILPDLKERLESEASAGGRTLGSEIERRLEGSFKYRSEHLALFEDERTFHALCAIAATWMTIEDVSGRPWYSNKGTIKTAKHAVDAILDMMKAENPIEPPKGLLEFALQDAAQRELGERVAGRIREKIKRLPANDENDKAIVGLAGDLFAD
ncbi:hypothetical protein FPV16_23455 [Methylobacterium sp. W2]|uniref:hypothetical protein n=1 Tax=Methylobacterium sp. W2 TaxID=2598107 RepID=UPI001D0C7443|nr:hypothetical protein [Methylobacterium sp. W2]MCC0809120.1 hypothetical protein [Methylobacterium sp. W2]